jgi:cytosine/adenosine deaminase-related metal-dependent hydrolase
LLRGAAPELATGDLDANLVYGAGGSVVDTTVVAGRVLMRDRVLPEAEEITAEVSARAARLTAANR